MSVTIYKYGTLVQRAEIKVDNDSQQQVGLMRENILVLNFSVTAPIAFQIGDYCRFMGVLYQINRLPERTRLSKRRIAYKLQMESEQYDLGKVQLLFLDANNNFTDSDFILREKVQGFGDLIIFNLKRVYPFADWKLGFVEDTDFKTIPFSAQNCQQALATIAQQFETEFLIEGKTIHIYKRQTPSSLVLEQGKNKALLNLNEKSLDASNIITRLYAYGSTKNITPDYRDGSKRLRMGITNYIEKNIDVYRVFEFTKIFDGSNDTKEIYPHRTGTITAVDDPFNFYDTTIDFNVLDYLIPNTSAKITFNTGLLSGYTFEIAAGGFDSTTKKFTILKNTDETNIDVPSVSYTPAIGDTYVITDITMPLSYYVAAEQELRIAAQAYLDKNSVPALVYSADCNSKYFQDNNVQIGLGQAVVVRDTQLAIEKVIRITAYTRNINDVYLYSVELSEVVEPRSIIVKLINGL